MLADTVGFIHRLPHMLVEAFKATLEEVRVADLLLHVVDASSPLAGERMTVVDRVLEEIGAGSTPRLVVLNKTDLIEHTPFGAHAYDGIAVSALRKDGLEHLLAAIARCFGGLREEIIVRLPVGRGDLIALARRDGEILIEQYTDGVVALRALVSTAVAGRLRKAALAEY
jgi:GTP-binding protein HflX